jgi:HK97 family phage portal protein
MNPQDAQLLESRYFGVEEICRTFKTPPQLIYHMDKASSWASSLEQMNLGYLTYSLRPTLVRIEQTVARKLLSVEDRAKYKPKFSVEGLLRADSAGRANFYSTLLQNGVMTRNEVRGLEDLPEHANADQLTVQLNLTPIDQLGKTNEQI